ncbi:MAG: ATP synthase subunit C, partial [Candidatus Asgardarchaeia archaeon]
PVLSSCRVFAYQMTAEEATFYSYKFMTMAIAVALPALAATFAVTRTGTSAIASITEKPELFGKTVIFVGLAEGIAIYGLLVAFLIWITGA